MVNFGWSGVVGFGSPAFSGFGFNASFFGCETFDCPGNSSKISPRVEFSGEFLDGCSCSGQGELIDGTGLDVDELGRAQSAQDA